MKVLPRTSVNMLAMGNMSRQVEGTTRVPIRVRRDTWNTLVSTLRREGFDRDLDHRGFSPMWEHTYRLYLAFVAIGFLLGGPWSWSSCRGLVIHGPPCASINTRNIVARTMGKSARSFIDGFISERARRKPKWNGD